MSEDLNILFCAFSILQLCMAKLNANNIISSAVVCHKKIYLNNCEIKISARETECLHYLLDGLSAKQTARKMNLSVRTVECHLNNLRVKTHSKTKLDLVCKLKNSL